MELLYDGRVFSVLFSLFSISMISDRESFPAPVWKKELNPESRKGPSFLFEAELMLNPGESSPCGANARVTFPRVWHQKDADSAAQRPATGTPRCCISTRSATSLSQSSISPSPEVVRAEALSIKFSVVFEESFSTANGWFGDVSKMKFCVSESSFSKKTVRPALEEYVSIQ